MTDSDDKLKDLNKNELNELSKKVMSISKKELTKDLINEFSIFNGAKYFSSQKFQNYLVFIPANNCIKYFSGSTRIDLWKSMECQKKKMKIWLNQTGIFHQILLIIIYYQT